MSRLSLVRRKALVKRNHQLTRLEREQSALEAPHRAGALVDSGRAGIYTAAMLWKAVAAFVVCIWLMLFGVEFLEDLGRIHYATAGMDEAMDEALDGFGRAMVSSDDAAAGAPASLASPYEAIYSFACPIFSFGPSPTDVVKETEDFQKPVKVNTLHQVFLF